MIEHGVFMVRNIYNKLHSSIGKILCYESEVEDSRYGRLHGGLNPITSCVREKIDSKCKWEKKCGAC